ncbi:MAG TPA: lasso peptide biosynthesis B2 protein [Rhizomicrobium sp.]|nr:lasso peptide biosynthesis B2 protein [Rhizomicrobium sp.]
MEEDHLMPLVLRPGFSWCICAEQAVFLDLTRDRYLCLPEALDRAFQRWATGEALSPAEHDALIATSILEPGAGERTPVTWYEPAQCDQAIGSASGGYFRDILAAVAGQLRARRWLRHRSIANIVSFLEQERANAPGTQDDERHRQRIASAFVSSAMLLRAADQCLPRAIAAWRICQHHGIEAALILGIRVNPFAAHSWVQAGDAVIVGDYERVRLYTPILVLR